MAVRPLDHARFPQQTIRPGRLLAGFRRRLVEVGGRAQRTSQIVRARVGYAAGVATAAWGIGVQFGLGWALIVGGVAMSCSFLLLYPVDGS